MKFTEYLTEGPFRFSNADVIKTLDVLDFVANEIKGKGKELVIKVYGTPGKESGGIIKIDGKKMSKREAATYLNKYL